MNLTKPEARALLLALLGVRDVRREPGFDVLEAQG